MVSAAIGLVSEFWSGASYLSTNKSTGSHNEIEMDQILARTQKFRKKWQLALAGKTPFKP